LVGNPISPIEIDALYLPYSTTLEIILKQHRKRVERHLWNQRGSRIVRIGSTENLMRMQRELQKIKGAFGSISPMRTDMQECLGLPSIMDQTA
jgi:hypothetical protein